jgi:hypothetical protein
MFLAYDRLSGNYIAVNKSAAGYALVNSHKRTSVISRAFMELNLARIRETGNHLYCLRQRTRNECWNRALTSCVLIFGRATLTAGLRLNSEAAEAVGCRLPEVESVTPQEEQLLNSLVERVNQTQLQEKDPDAEALLNRGLGGNPDALYIMAQTVLVQNIALEQAKAQVTQLQQQVQQARQQPARSTSFLGNLLGHRDPAPPPPPAYLPPQQGYVPPPPPPPGYVDPLYQQQYIPAGQPSFLRGAMQTAAGVAAGALAFEGVEAVLHGMGGFGHPGFGRGGPGMGMGMGGFGMGPGMMGGGFGRPAEETVINNNYYDQPGGQVHGEHGEHGGFQQGGFDQGGLEHGGGEPQHFRESADQAGAQISDANYNTTGNDQGTFDNQGQDDNSLQDDNAGQDDNSLQDDNAGYDDGGQSDGGSFDDGGGGGFDDGGGFDGGGGDLS